MTAGPEPSSRAGRRRLTRRHLLGIGVGVGWLAALGPAAAQDLGIRPRATWGADLSPTGPLPVEAPGDVRFLLVHHTASANDYAPGDVPGLLRAFHRTHTADRGWPDIAYNFLVDRFGGVWEGRQGSLDAPVLASATGGSQGFAQLGCFIGDHEAAPPTAEATAAMVALLAVLAQRYALDPRGRTTFVSRGSNRHPAGTTVETAVIAGHRDMSRTVCPGRFGAALVADLPDLVATRMRLPAAGSPAPVPAAPPTAQPTGPAIEPPAIEPPVDVTSEAPDAAPPDAQPPAPADRGAPVDGRDLAVDVKRTRSGPSPEGLRLTAASLVTLVGGAAATVVRRDGLRPDDRR